MARYSLRHSQLGHSAAPGLQVVAWFLFAAASAAALSAQDGETLLLSTDTREARRIKGGEAHRFRVHLGAGEFAKVTAMQQGIDVVLTSFAPGGRKLKEVDSPNGMSGPESVPIVAEVAGDYIVEVRSLEPRADPGRYEIGLDVVLSAAQYARYGIHEVSRHALESCMGTYEVGPGRELFVGINDEMGVQLVYMDSKTGRFGLLYSHSETEYFTGPNLFTEYPVTREFAFQRDQDGRISRLTLTETGGERLSARRVAPYRTEEVRFKSGDRTLVGSLYVPEGKGPHPAVVYVHGSGDRTRFANHFAPYFTSRGFAALAFDKQGVGQSTGNWQTASFDALAEDVVAAVGVLKSRPDVKGHAIGLWGVSQGGWIGPLAASRSPDVAFLLVQVGSGVPVWENVAHESFSQMRDAGLSADELAEGHAFAKRVYKMASDGAEPEAVYTLTSEHRGKPYADFVYMARMPKGSPWWAWFKANGNVDPAEILPRVKCPTLWLLGDRDSQVPTAQSEPRIRAAFRKGGNEHLQLVVFPRAGHPLLECETGLRSELPKLDRLVPGYFAAMDRWLSETVR